jgi:hypothetical protein
LLEADGEIDTLRNQIADVSAGHELYRELGMALAERAEPTRQDLQRNFG